MKIYDDTEWAPNGSTDPAVEISALRAELAELKRWAAAMDARDDDLTRWPYRGIRIHRDPLRKGGWMFTRPGTEDRIMQFYRCRSPLECMLWIDRLEDDCGMATKKTHGTLRQERA